MQMQTLLPTSLLSREVCQYLSPPDFPLCLWLPQAVVARRLLLEGGKWQEKSMVDSLLFSPGSGKVFYDAKSPGVQARNTWQDSGHLSVVPVCISLYSLSSPRKKLPQTAAYGVICFAKTFCCQATVMVNGAACDLEWCWKKPSSHFCLKGVSVEPAYLLSCGLLGTCLRAPKPCLLSFICFP